MPHLGATFCRWPGRRYSDIRWERLLAWQRSSGQAKVTSGVSLSRSRAATIPTSPRRCGPRRSDAAAGEAGAPPERVGVNAAPRVDQAFRERFRQLPRYHVRAPGRVNLIGEHTDYNDGFVLPAAIDRFVVIAAAPADDRVLRLHSLTFGEEVLLPVDHPEAPAGPPWARYIQGVAGELRRGGVPLPGLRAVGGGDLPIGAGLGRSAALEVAAALTLLEVAPAALSRREGALLAQRAEAEFVGVRCGIMDQFTVALARPGHALFLDCRTLV